MQFLTPPPHTHKLLLLKWKSTDLPLVLQLLRNDLVSIVSFFLAIHSFTISGQFWNSFDTTLHICRNISVPSQFCLWPSPPSAPVIRRTGWAGKDFFYERSSSLLEIGLSWDQCSCRLAGGLSTQSQPLWVIIGPHTKQLHVYTLWIRDNKEPSLQLIFVI